jgi:hypothetical protein
MLGEQRSRELFDEIVHLREVSETDVVESYAHALYGFLYTDGHLVCTKIIDGPDVYSMLYQVRDKQLVKNWSNIVLYTEGWAAPIDEHNNNILPSKNPEAKRVRLICILFENFNFVESIISIDQQEDNQYDTSGQGMLAEALKQLLHQVKRDENYDNSNDKFFYI